MVLQFWQFMFLFLSSSLLTVTWWWHPWWVWRARTVRRQWHRNHSHPQHADKALPTDDHRLLKIVYTLLFINYCLCLDLIALIIHIWRLLYILTLSFCALFMLLKMYYRINVWLKFDKYLFHYINTKTLITKQCVQYWNINHRLFRNDIFLCWVVTIHSSFRKIFSHALCDLVISYLHSQCTVL